MGKYALKASVTDVTKNTDFLRLLLVFSALKMRH